MAKAGAPKKPKPKPKMTDKKQSERFVRTARDLEAEEDSQRFEEVFAKIVPVSKERPKH